MSGNPKVSVLLMAHNHIAFVDEALSGIEDQRAPFEIEVLLNDDFSTDGTTERLEHFARASRHPCRVLRSAHNLGAMPAVGRGIRAATGTHIAFLDADDRWCDAGKLAAQADILDRRGDLAIAFHDVAVIDPNGTRTGKLWNGPDQAVETTIDDLVYGCYAHTSSLMLRRAAVDPLPQSYDTFPSPLTDWPLLMLAATSGGLHYDAPVMSEYRLHDGGLYQGMHRRRQVEMTARVYRQLKPLVPPRLRPRLEEERRVFLGAAAAEAGESGRRSDALRHQLSSMQGAIAMRRPRAALRDVRQLVRLVRAPS